MSVSITIPTLYPPPYLSTLIANISQCVLVSDIHIVHNHTKKIQYPTIPKATHHYLEKNTGFTGACNYGATQAKGTHLLFLNDDCSLETTTIDTLQHFLNTHPDLSATQPVVLNTHKQIEHIGFEIDTKIGKAHAITNRDTWSRTPQPHYVRGLSGTCLLIKKDIFVSAGMFDETFHSYLEDVDLALTFFEKDLSSLPCLEASVIHRHMQTSSQMGTYKQRQDLLNWWRIIIKHPTLFIRYNTLHLLISERLKNLNGLLKQYFKKSYATHPSHPPTHHKA